LKNLVPYKHYGRLFKNSSKFSTRFDFLMPFDSPFFGFLRAKWAQGSGVQSYRLKKHLL